MSAKPTLWLSLACLALVVLAFNYYPCQLDDAFITYRYAAHVAEHGTLAYNLGEAPVEGFSSPLWLGLLSLFAVCFGKSALPDIAFGLGVTFAIGTCLVAYRFSSRLIAMGPDNRPAPTLRGLAGATLLVICPAVAYYAATGLEPMLFLLLVLSSLAAAVGSLPAWAGLAAAIALPWTRPEAAVFPVIWGVIYLFDRGARRGRRLALTTAVFGASLLTLLVVRFWTFGDLLPNTYYAKLPDRMRGVRYVADLLVTPWAGALVLLGGLGAACAGRMHKALLASAGMFLLIAVAEGGDWMPLGRFALPAFGALAVAASGVLAAPAKAARAAAGLVALIMLFGNYGATTEQLSQMHRARRTIRHEDLWFSGWLKQTSARSLAIMDIGVIGFENDDVAIVDLAGLTDRTLARMQGHHLRKKIDPSYIVEKRPDLIVVRVENPPMSRPGALDPNAAMTQVEGDLLASRAVSQHYVLVMMILPREPRVPYYGRLVFARNDLSIPKDLLPPSPVFSLEPLAE